MKRSINSATTYPLPDQVQPAWQRERPDTSPHREDVGNWLTWLPGVALGTMIVGLATWLALRMVRRGRRDAARKTAHTARSRAESLRDSVRGSVRGAGTSSAQLVQTVHASAQEIAAKPRATARDTFDLVSQLPARYRWFRRGVRVGARASHMRMKMRRQ